jgi:hypothetical protein
LFIIAALYAFSTLFTRTVPRFRRRIVRRIKRTCKPPVDCSRENPENGQKIGGAYLLFGTGETILYIIMRDKGLPERIGGSLTKNGPHKEEKV